MLEDLSLPATIELAMGAVDVRTLSSHILTVKTT
eukprot:COSAG05_NODE_538_length_8854_cov_306.308738_6_plen_34_part_00